jgi:hypothetical protein
MMDPASVEKESAKARSALLEELKKNGRTWHDLQGIMADIEAEKKADAAAAAAATRARGWKPPDGDDLGIPGNDLIGLLLANNRDVRLCYAGGTHGVRALDPSLARLSHVRRYAATFVYQPDRKLRKDDSDESAVATRGCARSARM